MHSRQPLILVWATVVQSVDLHAALVKLIDCNWCVWVRAPLPSKTSVIICETTHCHMSEDIHLHNLCPENLTSWTVLVSCSHSCSCDHRALEASFIRKVLAWSWEQCVHPSCWLLRGRYLHRGGKAGPTLTFTGSYLLGLPLMAAGQAGWCSSNIL